MTTIQELITQIEADDCTTPEHILHRLLELSLAVTGRGCAGDDYTETIEFPMSNLTIVSDSYYGRTWIQFDKDDEIELEEEETLEKIADELKKRLLAFDKKIKKNREQLAKEIFDKPLKNIPLEEEIC